jgi:AAA+ superfamily predicted ATPase
MTEKTLQNPLKGWALDLARKWNSGAYSMYVLHGNIFDIFPVQPDSETKYLSLKSFLHKRIFSGRGYLLFYDIHEGLTFATEDMQSEFFKWLSVYDKVEKTDHERTGLPKSFNELSPILRRFFSMVNREQNEKGGVTLVIDFPEKIVTSSEDSNMNIEERISLVTLLKWATTVEFRESDVGVILVTEVLSEINNDLLTNPHIAQVQIDLPDEEDRQKMLATWLKNEKISLPLFNGTADMSARTAGLNLVRIQNMILEGITSEQVINYEFVAQRKKRLIEEYCQGLVKFKEPKEGCNLDKVATHTAAKKKFRDIVWLIKNSKRDVLEKGILLTGRVGVGKSYLVDCFASECGLPVMILGDFRSKWVGDTEKQLNKILLTIKALGPIIVVIDEADAVLGNREGSGDSGVSSRVFASLAAHIGDSSIRGKELWIAMTSRPDLMAIDMKRQGRFGLSIPLFPAQNKEEILDLFNVVAKINSVKLSSEILNLIVRQFEGSDVTGSDSEAVVVRAKEIACLNGRDNDVCEKDFYEAITSYRDPLDKDLLRLQELAAVTSCSDNRYLPDAYSNIIDKNANWQKELRILRQNLSFR